MIRCSRPGRHQTISDLRLPVLDVSHLLTLVCQNVIFLWEINFDTVTVTISCGFGGLYFGTVKRLHQPAISKLQSLMGVSLKKGYMIQCFLRVSKSVC